LRNNKKKQGTEFSKIFYGFQIYPENDSYFQSFQFWSFVGKAIVFEPKKHDSR